MSYFITAKFGLSLNPVSGFATLIWLPSGISLAALLIFGLRIWPGILLGAFLSNLFSGAPFPAALGIGIGNTLEAVIAAFLLQRLIHFDNSLGRLRDVLGLIIIAALFSTMISASIGIISLFFVGRISTNSLLSTWVTWWIGDLISDLIVAPLILVWGSRKVINFQPKKVFEVLSAIILFTLTYLIIFGRVLSTPVGDRPLTYMLFPTFIWMALRFGQPGVVMASFVLSFLTTSATLQNLGPFARDNPSRDLLFLQLFMAIISSTSMILAAVIAERRLYERLKDEFISIAAHELKTPLTTLKGYNQLLTEHLKINHDKKALGYTLKMVAPINNLTRLISDFFDVSKIQAGKLDLQKELFEFDDLVREVVEDMQQLSPKHKIILSGKTKKQVLADRYRIDQVIINLISNAIKFSPKANKVQVSLATDQKSVNLTVRDFGIGILKRDLEKVFKRFFQANTQIRQSVGGLGLGLYISSEIIKQHDGRIWVSSVKGKGSAFSFSLPINQTEKN